MVISCYNHLFSIIIWAFFTTGKITPKLRSNWNTTELLLQEFSDGDVKPRSASELPEEIIVEKGEQLCFYREFHSKNK